MHSIATPNQPPGSRPKPRRTVHALDPRKKHVTRSSTPGELHENLVLVLGFSNEQEAVVADIRMAPENIECDFLTESAIPRQP